MKILSNGLSIIIFIVGGFSLWTYIHKSPGLSLNKNLLSEQVDSTISDLHVEVYDADGKLTEIFDSPLVQHLPKKNIHLASFPKLVSKKSLENSYTIEAKNAVSENNGSKIKFQHEVIMHKFDTKTQASVSTLKTEELTYLVKKKIAKTKSQVFYDEGNTHVRSKSLWIKTDEDNKSAHIVLSGNKDTQVHYWSQPDPKKPVVHAYADKMIYLPQKKSIELLGAAQVDQGGNIFSSPKIIYDLANKHLQSSSNLEQKTTFVFKKSFAKVKL